MDTSQNIEFIEGASFKAVPAPLGKRTLAFLIDLGIVSVVQVAFIYLMVFGFILLAIFIPVLKQMGLKGTPWINYIKNLFEQPFGLFHVFVIILMIIVLLVIYALTFGVVHFYFIYNEFKKKTTLGKKMLGLSIISAQGTNLTLRQCILREMMRWIEAPLVLPALISMGMTKRHQRLGDLMAGTVVVHSGAKEKSSNFIYLTMEEYQVCFQDWGNPRFLSKENADNFLTFAYPTFIYSPGGRIGFNKLGEARKLQMFYPDLKIETIPDDILDKFLRFHAQYCTMSFGAG